MQPLKCLWKYFVYGIGMSRIRDLKLGYIKAVSFKCVLYEGVWLRNLPGDIAGERITQI